MYCTTTLNVTVMKFQKMKTNKKTNRQDSIGVGAQSTLEGQDIFAQKYMHKKLTK